jgi:hypothetical protein
MAWRYRQRRMNDGDVVTPEDWVLNNKEFAEEFNGYLDRDNFNQAMFGVSVVSTGTFNKVHSDAHDATDNFITDTEIVEWQKVSTTGIQLGYLSIDCPVDCLLKCEFGAYWDVNLPPNPAEVRFRITVDGISVADGGWLSGQRLQWGTHLLGATFVTAGKHEIRAEVQVAQVDEKGTNNYSAINDFVEIKNRELVVVERRR